MPQSVALLPARRARVVPPPGDLGEVLDAEQIRQRFFAINGEPQVSVRWVLDHFAPEDRWFMGRRAVWYEAHARRWMPDYVAQQQAKAQKARPRSRKPRRAR